MGCSEKKKKKHDWKRSLIGMVKQRVRHLLYMFKVFYVKLQYATTSRPGQLKNQYTKVGIKKTRQARLGTASTPRLGVFMFDAQ